jgi:chromate transporter
MTKPIVPPVMQSEAAHRAPHEALPQLFLRFLRFGLLAWGGPAAQIGMIRHELVEQEGWISKERFNRVLAVYQILPGPEATELCVYFGYIARGLLFMLLLTWFYLRFGLASPLFTAAFHGMQAAVGALIVRAIHRIGSHALHDRWLWSIALGAMLAQLAGINFLLTLGVAGLIYALVTRGYTTSALALGALTLGTVLRLGWPQFIMLLTPTIAASSTGAPGQAAVNLTQHVALVTLFLSGLRSGLLTFGGAYTVISYLQQDAVTVGHWMTNAQFLDGLALAGILPAPLVIFGTFVGWLGGGLSGALVLTLGIFAPAFAFTLIGHEWVERLVANQALHSFLDGVTAGVVGLIAATTLGLLRTALTDIPTVLIFVVGLFILFRWKSKINVPVVVLGAAVIGLLVYLSGFSLP